jgi:transposase
MPSSGIDTHRDSHEVEIADPAGRPIAVLRIGNDSAGFARLLAAIAEMAPGPRVAVCIEGTRGYGIGLARALAVPGCWCSSVSSPAVSSAAAKASPTRSTRTWRCWPALRLDAGKVPVPRADGDREALRILLVARQEITEASTAQTGRLRTLLLAGDDTDRRAARTTLTQAVLAALAGRDLPAHASREQAVRQAEIRRLALVLGQARRDLKDNRAQLLAIVEDIAPGLTSRFGVGPVSAAQAIVSFSHPGPVPQRSAYAALAGTSPLPASSGQTVRHRLNRGGDRALNRAIHAIALVRMRSCPRAGLRCPAHRRGKDPQGNPPLHQALYRPRALPAAHPLDESSGGPLTNIEASNARPPGSTPDNATVWRPGHAL